VTSLRARLAQLEHRFRGPGDVVLIAADGSTTQTIPLSHDYSALDVSIHAVTNPNSPEADAIRRSIGAREPGGSRLIEVTRAILMSPGVFDPDPEDIAEENFVQEEN
jgi:hypothetical protein